jgi:ABC-type dipeptide/oligopeptide/nickel transport system permease component
MTANIPAAVFNTLVLAFFVVVAIGVALGAYAAIQMKKMEEKIQK